MYLYCSSLVVFSSLYGSLGIYIYIMLKWGMKGKRWLAAVSLSSFRSAAVIVYAHCFSKKILYANEEL